jgi:hypothetical protein
MSVAQSFGHFFVLEEEPLKRLIKWRIGAVAALTAAFTLSGIEPASAAEPSTTPTSRQSSLAAATSAKLASLDAASALAATQASVPASADRTSQSFFKSPRGVAVIILMAVGTGYAIYSASSERIANPVR